MEMLPDEREPKALPSHREDTHVPWMPVYGTILARIQVAKVTAAGPLYLASSYQIEEAGGGRGGGRP